MRITPLSVLLVLCALPLPALAQKAGWMDIQDCPAKHPGP